MIPSDRRIDPSATARRLFSPIAASYDRPAEVLSLFQYGRWHRYLLSQLQVAPPAHVLDMATGTGSVALRIAERPGLRVTGADITRPMLLRAKGRAALNSLSAPLDLVECTAEAIPFDDSAFDAVVFTYLLRYVSDVPSTLHELARVLKPNGMMLSLDFAVPSGVLTYPLWRLFTSIALPLGGAVLSPAWMQVGGFLGKSIRSFYQQWPQEQLLALWQEAGFIDVAAQFLSLGGALVMSGRKRA